MFKQKHFDLFLKIFGVLSIAYGLSGLILTELMIGLLQAEPPGSEAFILARGWGLTLIGFGAVSWFASTLSSETKVVVTFGIFIFEGPLAVFWLIDMIARGVTVLGILTFVLIILLAARSAYFRFMFDGNGEMTE